MMDLRRKINLTLKEINKVFWREVNTTQKKEVQGAKSILHKSKRWISTHDQV